MAEITHPSGVSAWLDETSFVLFGHNEWPYYDGIPDRDPYLILPDDVQVTVSMNSFVLLQSNPEGHPGRCRPRNIRCDPLDREEALRCSLHSERCPFGRGHHGAAP